MRKIAIFTFLVLNYFCCDASVECPVSTREHTSECNKYFKCIKLPFERLSWITLTCPEGLVYDKNLRSCAIPTDDWDCPLSSSREIGSADDENIYGVENLKLLNDEDDEREAKDDSDEFLAVIDGDENLAETRSVDEVSSFSGDGEIEVENFVTPSSPTVRMITTQVQRLTQLVNSIAKSTKDVTPDDLNSFLDRQKIQFEESGETEGAKTTLPADGKVHPEVEAEIINRQNKLTTLSMERATTPMPPFRIIDQNPITEIKLKGGQGLDSGSHQIVVNRPEGSVLFNVPSSPDRRQTPYLSSDILKAILDLSTNLVTSNQKSQPHSINYQPQPVYYAIPVPIYQHQNYYGSNYQNYSQPTLPPSTTTARPKVEIKNNLQNGYFDGYGNFYYYPQTSVNKNYPSYSNYPSYTYQQPQGYNPFYYQQYSQNNLYNDQNGAFYEQKRPFVLDSSAPSYLDQQQPFRKESLISDSGYEADDEESDDETLFDEPPPPKDPTDGLICTNVLARQANKTDCFKYYVCNAKTKEVLAYTCPPMTAFNDQTKFCDSTSYKDCTKMQEHEKKSALKRRRVSAAHKAWNKKKKESQKVDRIASFIRKQPPQYFYDQNQFSQPSNNFYEYQKVYQPPETSTEAVREEEEIEIPIRQTVSLKRVARPQVKQKTKKKKSKKVKCTVLGAIEDPSDESSYWHCFKDERDGRIKRIHRKCSGSLKFCAATRFCARKC